MFLHTQSLTLKKNINKKNFTFFTFQEFEQSEVRADCTISLDVIYHLTDDATYEHYMNALFDFSNKYVVLFSTNHPDTKFDGHVRHRRFSRWININKPDWQLINFVNNPSVVSSADFYMYSLEGEKQ